MGLAFFDQHSSIAVRNIPEAGRVEKVPAGVYRISVGEAGLDLIKDRPKFKLPSKIFGNHHANLKRIYESYQKADGTTGVILNGLKGAGKSLLAEGLGNRCLKDDVPVLMITDPIPAGLLKSVLKIIGPCMVYFDEFGKVYSSEVDRALLLPLFSDTDLRKVMFVLTSNEAEELNKYMINRPGRFKFSIHYDGLTADMIKETLSHHDIQGDMAEMLLAYASVHTVSFDILMYMVQTAKEVSSLKELQEYIEILNVPSAMYKTYNIDHVVYKGKPFVGETIVRQLDEGFSIDLIADESLEMLFHSDVNMSSTKKTTTRDEPAAKTYTVELTGDVTLRVTAAWSRTVRTTGVLRRQFTAEEPTAPSEDD